MLDRDLVPQLSKPEGARFLQRALTFLFVLSLVALVLGVTAWVAKQVVAANAESDRESMLTARRTALLDRAVALAAREDNVTIPVGAILDDCLRDTTYVMRSGERVVSEEWQQRVNSMTFAKGELEKAANAPELIRSSLQPDLSVSELLDSVGPLDGDADPHAELEAAMDFFSEQLADSEAYLDRIEAARGLYVFSSILGGLVGSGQCGV